MSRKPPGGSIMPVGARGTHQITRADVKLVVLALRQKAMNDRQLANGLLGHAGVQRSRLYIEQARRASVLANQIAGV